MLGKLIREVVQAPLVAAVEVVRVVRDAPEAVASALLDDDEDQ